MRQIFSNAAVSELTANFSSTDLTVYVLDTSNFPDPKVGEEFFLATLVGACEKRVEIVRVIENCGDCLRIDRRGLEGTVATNWAVADNIYHALTAGQIQAIWDSWQWYLGPFAIPPATDNNGDPLLEGHMYFNTVNNTLYIWDGEKWIYANPFIGGAQVAEYTWLLPSGHTGGVALPWPDTYGRTAGNWDANNVVLELYLNGSKLAWNAHIAMTGDFDIDYGADEIIPLNDFLPGDLVEAKLLMRIDADALDYILRTETDASGFGFVLDEDDMASDSPLHLATQQSIKAYMDAIAASGMVWAGKWAAGAYLLNEVVLDGTWTMIANKDTSEQAAPQPTGVPEYSMLDVPTMTDTSVAGTVTSGNTYTFNTEGWLQNLRVWVPNTTTHAFTIEISDITVSANPNLLYSTIASALEVNSWNSIPIPNILVENNAIIRVQIVALNSGGNTEWSYESAYWTGGEPTWATVAGYLYHTGAVQGGQGDNAFGIDLEFQNAVASGDWDVVSTSGGQGSDGGGGGGGGPLHTISNDPPDNAVGNEGDMWFVPVD